MGWPYRFGKIGKGSLHRKSVKTVGGGAIGKKRNRIGSGTREGWSKFDTVKGREGKNFRKRGGGGGLYTERWYWMGSAGHNEEAQTINRNAITENRRDLRGGFW